LLQIEKRLAFIELHKLLPINELSVRPSPLRFIASNFSHATQLDLLIQRAVSTGIIRHSANLACLFAHACKIRPNRLKLVICLQRASFKSGIRLSSTRENAGQCMLFL
jgi:hypothetical protein